MQHHRLTAPYRGFVFDKLPWQPGFVCISTDRIMTAVMDGITGAVQRCLEQEASWRSGRSWPSRRCAHARVRQLWGWTEVRDDTWERESSPVGVRLTGAKWVGKFISYAYVLTIIYHSLSVWYGSTKYSSRFCFLRGEACFPTLTLAGVIPFNSSQDI